MSPQSPSQHDEQGVGLEQQAYRLAMRDWVAQQPSLQVILAQQGLPEHLRAQAQQEWMQQRSNAASTLSERGGLIECMGGRSEAAV